MARPKTKVEEATPAPQPAVARAEWGDVLPSWLRFPWLLRLSGEMRVALALGLVAALIVVPWLGAVGFWDPWEVHYGEVAREMIARGDYIHPWWESAWFFSKPALDLWLMAAGMLIADVNAPERHVGAYTEWGVRLPYAAVSALGALLIFFAANRLLGRRPAIFGALAILTSPLFVLMSRQAVPDPLFVGLLTASMACLLIVLFDGDEEPREGWTIAFYCFVGLATLSKGLLGFALPGAVALVYFVITGEWHRLKSLRLGMGALIVLAICAPWYGTMFGFDGRDDEGKSFFERFIIHDHFKRLAIGVYTTTPGGTFTYFIEQIGFDTFPWVFGFPGAAAMLSRVRARPANRTERALLFLLLWLLIGFAVFAFSATKFHHYAFPALPPLLLLTGLWLDRVLEDGLRAHTGELLAGGLLYALVAHDLAMSPKHFTDLFVFNYERPYPDRETDPRQFLSLLFYAAPAVALSPWLFDRVAQIWNALRRKKPAGLVPEAEPPQDRHVTLLALCGLALSLAVFLGWFHWRRLSPHWTQRDLFWEYFQKSSADEPIGAYQMNWRGETFYSRNTVRQIGRPTAPSTTLPEFLAGPGARKWILVEQGRLAALRSAIGPGMRLRVVESRNNKFVLTAVEKDEQQTAPAATPAVPGPFGAPN